MPDEQTHPFMEPTGGYNEVARNNYRLQTPETWRLRLSAQFKPGEDQLHHLIAETYFNVTPEMMEKLDAWLRENFKEFPKVTREY